MLFKLLEIYITACLIKQVGADKQIKAMVKDQKTAVHGNRVNVWHLIYTWSAICIQISHPDDPIMPACLYVEFLMHSLHSH